MFYNLSVDNKYIGKKNDSLGSIYFMKSWIWSRLKLILAKWM